MFFLQWASLVAQTVKHLSATRETWVWSLGHVQYKILSHTCIFYKLFPPSRQGSTTSVIFYLKLFTECISIIILFFPLLHSFYLMDFSIFKVYTPTQSSEV